jgi:hypothetical protein
MMRLFGTSKLCTRKMLSRNLPQRLNSSVGKTATDNFVLYFPVVGVAVGLTALAFQVLVLFPWHETLSKDFLALEVNINLIRISFLKRLSDVLLNS